MADMTLREALLTDEVREMLRSIVRDEVRAALGGLRESPEPPADPRFLGPDSPLAKRLRHKGLNPEHFGATPDEAA